MELPSKYKMVIIRYQPYYKRRRLLSKASRMPSIMTTVLASLRSASGRVPLNKSSPGCIHVRRRLSASAGKKARDGADYGVRIWGTGASGQLGFPMQNRVAWRGEPLGSRGSLATRHMGLQTIQAEVDAPCSKASYLGASTWLLLLPLPPDVAPSRVRRQNALSNYQELLPRGLTGFESSGVRAMDCGADHTALVTMDGRVLTWGSAKNHKLGLSEEVLGRRGQQNTPAEIESLRGVNIVAVSCGEHHTVVVDDKGTAYSWGWGGSYWSGGGALGLGSTKEVPLPTEITELSSQGAKVEQVQAGQNHTVFLTTDGEVWTCGTGEYGLCGTGGTGDQLVPCPLEAFEDHVIVDVKAGHAFSLALSSEGEVFGWGRNDSGQLGLGGGLTMDVYSMESDPRPIESLSGEKVVALGAGHNHATAVTEDGRLFTWGMKRTLEPEWMSVLEGERVVASACGERFTAIITDAGSLYTFGRGGTCCLGHGNKTTLAQPMKVEALSQLRVQHVVCGHRHIAALVAAS